MKFRLSSKLWQKLKRTKRRLALVAALEDRLPRGLDGLGIERLVVALDRWQLDDVEKALQLLDEVGYEAVLELTKGASRPLLEEPKSATFFVRDILSSVVTGEAMEFEPTAPTALQAEKAALANLRKSAEKCEGEPFWQAYLGAVQKLHQEVLERWRSGKLAEGEAKALTWVLDALPKLTKLVRAVEHQHEVAHQRLLMQEHWKKVAQKGRLKHD